MDSALGAAYGCIYVDRVWSILDHFMEFGWVWLYEDSSPASFLFKKGRVGVPQSIQAAKLKEKASMAIAKGIFMQPFLLSMLREAVCPRPPAF